MIERRVLVRRINNLSDARYCAGMGVQYISFVIDKGDKDYLDVPKVVEIKNWLSGVECGIEITAKTVISNEDLKAIEPNFIVLSENHNHEELTEYPHFQEGQPMESNDARIATILPFLTDNDDQSCFLELPQGDYDLEEWLQSTKAYGLTLYGGNESRPGYSDYGELMDVLEALDEF